MMDRDNCKIQCTIMSSFLRLPQDLHSKAVCIRGPGRSAIAEIEIMLGNYVIGIK